MSISISRPGDWSLATKTTAMCVALGALLAAALMLQGYSFAAEGLREQAEAALGSDARLVHDFVDGWNAQRLTELRALSRLAAVRSVAAGKANAASMAAAAEALASIAASSKDVDSIAICDDRGNIMLNTNGDDAKSGTSNVRFRDYFQRAALGEEFISGVSISTLSGKPAIFHSVPVLEGGHVVGVLRSRAGLSSVQAAVAAAKDRTGAGAQGILLDEDGLVIANSIADDWLLHPIVAVSAERLSQLLEAKRWGKGTKAWEAIGEQGLGAAVGLASRAVLRWRSSGGIVHHVVALPLATTRWSYAVAQPVTTFSRRALELRRAASASAIAALVVTGVLAFLLSRRLTAGIVELTAAASRIVRDGDLTQHIEARSADEVGRLATAFAALVAKLREIPLTLDEAARSLAVATSQLKASVGEQQEFVGHQAAALQETQVTAQELKQVSEVTAQKSQSVLQVSERAESIGRSGEEATARSLASIGGMRNEVATIARHMQDLDANTRAVESISNTVKDLADQSNMLALNAAIEAVRSGEHGKGFAVVAREIRSLADQSIHATTKVREILQQARSAISAAVRTSDEGSRKMEVELEHVKTFGSHLRELSSIVLSNAAAARQIAAAVSQQGAGISQIFGSVTTQTRMMESTRSALDQTAKAVDVLNRVSDRVVAIVRQYRV